MTLKSNIIVLSFFLTGISAQASKLEKGFEALSIYDYFKAKSLFYEVQAKTADAYSAYGLAIIFSRNDNPFSNIDSAGKYIRLAYHRYLGNPVPQNLSSYSVDSVSVANLADTIAGKMYTTVKQVNTISAYDFFLSNFYFAKRSLVNQAVTQRDELEYSKALEINTSVETKRFMLLHPQSSLFKEAGYFLETQLYAEQTISGKPESYIAFIKGFPENAMVNTALEKLFEIYQQQKDVEGLAFFVKSFPDAYQCIEAWKLLFSLSVKEFSFEELEHFVKTYPDFPLKNSILNELELNRITLYPYQLGDFLGFINERGKRVIAPVYDAATDFYEGLSVVSKSDSVYFINKKNVNPFYKVFEDASVFKNGIAPVKQNNKWFFINRQGQIISSSYDEINELSDEVYVVKLNNKYGALNHLGQIILEAKFDKLGDFKNGFAYYTERGMSGFVSKTGKINRAEFEWISDFSEDLIAVIKQHGKYGLIKSNGKIILDPAYDQILKTAFPFFILVHNNFYGFFSGDGCFLSPIAYDFVKEWPVELYTNGVLFKLHKNNEQALMDVNGAICVNFATYQEVYMPFNGLLRVKQKNKYGYIDEKFNPVIAGKYLQAGDFSDSLALVKYKDYTILLNLHGVEVFSSGAQIVKLSTHYYSVNDETRSVINSQGDLIYTDVDDIQQVNNLLIVTLNNGEIKLIYD